MVLDEFSIRKGSGGKGEYVGGAGVLRRIRFNEAMEVNILANRRKVGHSRTRPCVNITYVYNGTPCAFHGALCTSYGIHTYLAHQKTWGTGEKCPCSEPEGASGPVGFDSSAWMVLGFA